MKALVTFDRTSEDGSESLPPLTQTVDIPAEVLQDEQTQDGAVTDWLSDTFGWLVSDWKLYAQVKA